MGVWFKNIGYSLCLYLVGLSLIAQPVRELYIDETENILSDSIRKTEVLQCIETYNINQVCVFHYYNYVHLSGFQQFLVELKEAGVKRVVPTFPGYYFLLSEDGQDSLLDSLSGEIMSLEYDFWLTGGDEEAIKLIKALGRHKKQSDNRFRIYFGWFGEVVNKDAMALQICQTFDQLLLHHYTKGANFGYLEDRLVSFGKAAMRYGKRQEVVIRINIAPKYINTPSLDSIQNIYQELESKLKESSKQHKELNYIEFKGWQLYNSRYLKPITEG